MRMAKVPGEGRRENCGGRQRRENGRVYTPDHPNSDNPRFRREPIAPRRLVKLFPGLKLNVALDRNASIRARLTSVSASCFFQRAADACP